MGPPNVRIRTAAVSDSASIASVLFQAFAEYRPLYTPGGFDATTLPAGLIEKRMLEGPVWVAVREKEILGTVAVMSKGDALYIRGMAILPSARGQAIGQLLLHHIETY